VSPFTLPFCHGPGVFGVFWGKLGFKEALKNRQPKINKIFLKIKTMYKHVKIKIHAPHFIAMQLWNDEKEKKKKKKK